MILPLPLPGNKKENRDILNSINLQIKNKEEKENYEI